MSETLHHPFKNIISEIIHQCLQEHEIELAQIYADLNPPPKAEMGHLCYPCFPLAKSLKKAPPQIAVELIEKITPLLEAKHPGLISCKPMGPYLNFVFAPKFLGENLVPLILENDQFFKLKLSSLSQKTMIEYSQPNTHKDMHVGHMRNLSLGNALVNIFTYCSQEVIPVTYPGDVGTHVAKCLWYLKKFDHKFDSKLSSVEKGHLLGEIYTASTKKIEEEAKEEAKFESNKKELTTILKQLHAGEGEYFTLWQETRQWSLDLMKHIYQWADVEFDHWFFESDVDATSVDLIKKYYEQGKLVKDEGAIGMDLSEHNLGFCLLLKSDGTGLYATKDIELAVKKMDEFKIEKNIYVVDNRQAHHFNQVFKVMEGLGYQQASNCHHLQYAFVELPEGPMSSRNGIFLSLLTLIEKMEETICQNYLNKYLESGEWEQAEVDQTARELAKGAIKYGMTKVDNNRKIVFDMQEWLKLDGDTGPYLQYVCARINSLTTQVKYSDENSLDWSLLEKESEKNILMKLSHFNSIVYQCYEGQKTISLCSYLFELSKLYNSFYADCPIAKAEPSLKDVRLALSHATLKVLSKGLNLLGINAPERM